MAKRKIKKKKLTPEEREAERSRKAQRGLERKAHFESGGSLAEWNGINVVHKNKRDKRAGTRAQRKARAISEQD